MLLLLAVAGLLGAAVAVLPALAVSSSEAQLEVNENCVEAHWPCWATPSSSSPASTVTIAPGGEVLFTDHDPTTPANLAWTGTAPTCAPSVPVSPTAPATNWEGKCKFEQPGTYKFESSTLFVGDGLNYTKYEIVVEGASTGTTSTTTTTTPTTTTTTPTTTTTTPTTTTPTATTPTTTQPQGGGTSPGGGTSTSMISPSTETSPPAAGRPLATLALARAQHGSTVHGTVQVPSADSGARLEVELLAQTASLARVKRSGRSRVGRLVRASVSAGKVAFTVSLDSAAKRALHHHHRLALTVKIVLTPIHGAALTLAQSLDLR